MSKEEESKQMEKVYYKVTYVPQLEARLAGLHSSVNDGNFPASILATRISNAEEELASARARLAEI
jgi:hypothetical protein